MEWFTAKKTVAHKTTGDKYSVRTDGKKVEINIKTAYGWEKKHTMTRAEYDAKLKEWSVLDRLGGVVAAELVEALIPA